jgi:hypothetical protein
MPPSTRTTVVAAAVLLVAFAGQCLDDMRRKSPTFDEPTYLAAAWVSTTTDVDTNPAHPPLMKWLMALPLAAVGPSPATAIPLWPEALLKPRSFGVSFLFENQADPDTLLFAGRSAVLAVSLLLAVLVAMWAHQLYGSPAGLVALGLYAFCPNVIAHSSLATLDLGVSAGVAAASYALWRVCRRPDWRRGAVAGVALGLALLIKATALLLLALLPLQIAAALAWHRRPVAATPPPRARRRTAPASDPSPTRRLALASAVALVVAVALIAVTYGLPRYVQSFQHGFLNRGAYMNRAYEVFLWGRHSVTGFRWYFLAAFLLKTPIPTLAGTVGVIAWLARRWPDLFDELFLVLPILAFFVATAFTRDDLGLRYVLPVYPLLYVLIAGMTVAVLRWARERAGEWRAKATAGALGVLALGYVGGTLAVHPHHLAFFNGLVCGPGEGIRYLDDSNIDWGQDYKELVRHLRDHGIADAKGLYHPYHLAPHVARYYGVALRQPTFDEVRNPTPGWYAISAHLLQRPSLAEDPGRGPVRFDWLDRFTPVAKIGYSIYLYRFD